MDNIYKIDLILVIVSVFVLIFIFGYARPLVIAPLNDYETSDTGILFSIRNAEKLLIDDNSDFTTPDEYYVKDGLKISLSPGKYYWKAIGVFGSEVRTLTINSKVDLEIKEGDEEYNVVNAGNVGLNVDVYDKDELIDRVKLGVGDDFDSYGDKFIGGQDE